MNAEYKKAAEKLLCGITDKRLHEPTIWNDILSSVRSGKLRIWEINDEILRIKYFCKEKIERASAFTESDKSGVRFDDLNAYFVEAIKNGDMFTSNQGDLSVHYYDPESGRIRQYYPDFLAKMTDGSYQLIEVKGDNKIDDTVVKAKQAAAEEMAVASGVKYLMYAGSQIVSSHVLDDESSPLQNTVLK